VKYSTTFQRFVAAWEFHGKSICVQLKDANFSKCSEKMPEKASAKYRIKSFLEEIAECGAQFVKYSTTFQRLVAGSMAVLVSDQPVGSLVMFVWACMCTLTVSLFPKVKIRKLMWGQLSDGLTCFTIQAGYLFYCVIT